MKCLKNTESDTITLVLSEELTLPHAEEIRSLFLDTTGKGKNVRIKFESVTGIDLSLLQLLCSAHRTAIRLDADFALEGPLPEEFRQFIQDAGYVRHKACQFNTKNEGCLWLEATCNG